MNKLKIYLFVAVGTVFLNPTAAESSLTELIEKAYEERDEIEISREQMNLTRWRLVNAARFLGPAVMLEYRQAEGETITDPYRTESYGLRLQQPIFQGGERYYSYRRERKAAEVAKHSHRRAKEDVKFEVAEAYYGVLLKKSMLQSYEKLISQIEEKYSMAQRQYEQEIMTEIDFQDIVNLRDNIIVRTEMIEDELVIAKHELKNAVGMKGFPDIEKESYNGIYDESVLVRDMQETIDIALESRPELLIAEKIREQSQYDEKIGHSDRYPKISLEGFLGRSGEAYVKDDIPLVDKWSLFLNMEWAFWGNTFNFKYGGDEVKDPESAILDAGSRIDTDEQVAQFSLLDGLDRIYSGKEKEIVRMQSESDLKKTRNDVIKEVERNYRQFLRVMKMVGISRRRLETEERRIGIINKRWQLGDASIKDVMDAKYQRTQTETSLFESMANFYTSAAAINRSCGVDILPIEVLR